MFDKLQVLKTKLQDMTYYLELTRSLNQQHGEQSLHQQPVRPADLCWYGDGIFSRMEELVETAQSLFTDY